MNLVTILLLATSVFAGNFSSMKTPNKNYWERAACEANEGETCYDVDACPMRECSLLDVDDLSRPKFVKRQVISCSGESECRTELAVLTCTDAGAQPLIDAAFTQVYCAVPNGYEQKKGLVRDADKILALQAAQAADDQIVQRQNVGRARREAGLRIIDAINGNNDAKNMTVDQTIQLNQQLAPIISLLQSGSLKSARSLIEKLSPQGIITQADIDLTLQLLTREGA